MTMKVSARLTQEEVHNIYEGKYDFPKEKKEDIFKDFYIELAHGLIKPKVIVKYERVAFVHPVGDLRITFDTCIKTSNNQVDIFEKNIAYGFMENYSLVQTVLAKENYVAQYHEYLAILSEGYLKEETLSNKVLSVYEMIHTYVKNDPTSFYSYEEFENGVYGEDSTEVGLLDFARKRVENVMLQLSGEMKSINFGEGNDGSALGSGMEGQTLPEVDDGQMLPDGEIGENPPEGDNGQMLPDGEFGENPPEGDNGQMLPDGEIGENPPEMEEMTPMNEKNQNIGDSNELSNEIEEQETEGILLIFLVCLLTIMGVYLKKKH